MALPIGCSLYCSRLAAKVSRSVSLYPFPGTTSTTSGVPFVIVPVLSSTTTSVFPVISSAAAFLNRIPCFAPTPLPTITATGVASPSAHGQLITSTDIPLASTKPVLSPAMIHTIIVIKEQIRTAGTKIPDTLSAIFAIGAFVAAASLTISMIWDKVVSVPTLVARHFR